MTEEGKTKESTSNFFSGYIKRVLFDTKLNRIFIENIGFCLKN